MATKNTAATFDTVRPSDVHDAIVNVIIPQKLSLFLWGPPGIGKSALIKKIAKDYGYEFIDIRLSQMDPVDLRGIPVPGTDPETGEAGAVWSAPLILPRRADAKAIILLDEFNSAAPMVQAGAYQLVLDRRLGEYIVPEQCIIIAAGNRDTDKGVTYKMPTPLLNRFVHLEMAANFEDWEKVALDQGFNSNVYGYLKTRNDKLFSFNAKTDDRGFQTPRSWEFVSNIMNSSSGVSKRVLRALVSGAIGAGPATEFLTYVEHAADLPLATDVLDGKVKELKNKDVSLAWALGASLLYNLFERFKDHKQSVENNTPESKELGKKYAASVDNMCGFLMDNCQPEVVIMVVRTAIKQYRMSLSTETSPKFKEFMTQYKSYIMATVS